MDDKHDGTNKPDKWDAATIKEQWIKDRNTEQAIKRVNFLLKRIKEQASFISSFPEPSFLYDPGKPAKLATPEDLRKPFIEQEALFNLLQELEETLPTDTERRGKDRTIAVSIEPLIWRGSGLDLGRVYLALEKLLDCTQTEWEKHFISPTGDSFKGSVSEAKRNENSITRSSSIINVIENAKSMNKK